jgi:hypothetical protein
MLNIDYIRDKLQPSYEKNIIDRMNFLKEGTGNSERIYESFDGFFINFAKCGLILEQNINSIKLNLHYSTLGYNRRFILEKDFYLSLQKLMILSLSDNQIILDRLCANKYVELSKDSDGTLGERQAFYNIIEGDWNSLGETVSHLKNIKEGYHDLFFPEIHFNLYEGFIKQDQEQIENALNSLILKNVDVDITNHIDEEKFISFGVLAYAKQAYKYGLEIWQVDERVLSPSSLIPGDWLEYRPLNEYTIPLKFLRDFYREQGDEWKYFPIHPDLQDWDNDYENPNRKTNGFFKNLFS